MAITKEFANKVVEGVANFLNIPPCEITLLVMEGEYENMPGFYDDDKYIINVNKSIVKEFTDLEFTSFLIHEMRHAYQHQVVINNNIELESISTIKQWGKDIENYANPIKNEDEYLVQLIEIDAVAFTAYFSKRFLCQDLKIPNIIKKKVLNRIIEIENYYN